MSISEQIHKDMIEAMKARQGLRLSTLRMVKAALKNREIAKRAPLDDQESLTVLNTLIKQRHDSVEQFTKGGRTELADKETAEIAIIETYMPKALGAEEISATVQSVIDELKAAGMPPTAKDMGSVMKATMARFQASGARVDGKAVNEAVRKQVGTA